MRRWGSVSAVEQASRHDVFISYSYRQDRGIAHALQVELAKYGRPWYRPRVLRVFRDDTDLGASPGLWVDIEAALADSRWFLLMASPVSAGSRWVRREVAWWLANRSSARMLLGWTGGTLYWDDDADDFDWDKTDALPPELRGVFSHEPRWVDLRASRAGWQAAGAGAAGWRPRLGDVVAEFAAPVRGLAKEALVGEHYRQRRRTVRWVSGTLAALTMLAAAAATAAVVALDQRSRALAERSRAQEQARIAVARGLVAEAAAIRDRAPQTALKLGIAADRIRSSVETQTGLVQTVAGTRYAGTLDGHRGAANAVDFSPDAGTLASAGDDGDVILWDTAIRAERSRLPNPRPDHPIRVLDTAFSPVGHLLATGYLDGRVQLWDVSDPAFPRPEGPPLSGPRGVNSMAFSHSGRVLATGHGDGTVLLWDVGSPASAHRQGAPLTGLLGFASALTFSLDDATLATASTDTVLLWDLRNPRRPHKTWQLTASAYAAAFSPRGDLLVTGNGNGQIDGTVVLWNTAHHARPRLLGKSPSGHARWVNAVAFSPDGSMLATASPDESAVLWDLTDPATPRQVGMPLLGNTASVLDVAFSADGTTLATAAADGAVLLWDRLGPMQPRQIGHAASGTAASGPAGDHAGEVLATSFRPDHRVLATVDFDGTARLWDTTDSRRPHRLGRPLTGHDGPVDAVAFSPAGTLLVTGGWDGSIRLWDVSNPADARPLRHLADQRTGLIYAVTFSPHGHLLATASDSAVTLWDGDRLPASHPLGPPVKLSSVFSLAFSPDERILAAATGDGRVVRWDLTDPATPRQLGEPLHSNSGYLTLAFSPDGHTLATGGQDGRVVLWDTSKPAQLRQRGQPLTWHAGGVTLLAFSRDGGLLAAGGRDGPVILWNTTDPDQSSTLGQPLADQSSGMITGAFAADADLLATAGRHGTVLLWDMTAMLNLQHHTLTVACNLAGDGLDPIEWNRYIPDLPYQSTCR